ncbi:amino acid adenylation domain-containing protein [Burkholderia cenocepacia]|uniref:non-ribosomal peptide synthetase n=1 Tax=Burkholderia cenocepacia TaxID=95486 RepID=UPI000F587140|nr:non-ribosomal peptide synthetase [Burkholderia cenocepacia]RQU33434.1 amino acid adenylation domain-containing protein [Burkholderia cenocepacia]RQU58585.1 amino acid adenylation domain-containing protein [Burkholderia cenocepacia]
MDHNAHEKASVLPLHAFPVDKLATPIVVPRELTEWIARVSRGESRAELALWASLFCANFANFSSQHAFDVLVADGQLVNLIRYEHDEDVGFQAVAISVAAALCTSTTNIGEAQIGLCVGSLRPPAAMETLPFVLCIAPAEDDDRQIVSLHGTRSGELRTWTDYYWAGLVQLASSAAVEPTCTLATLDLLPPEQRELFKAVNSTGHEYQPVHGLVERFLTHAQARADDIAIHGVTRNFRWAELRDHAARLAMWMEAEHQVRGRVVAVITDRHELCVPTFLAIAMAGATYLPLSPEYPAQRLLYILSDAGAVLTLSIGDVPEVLRGASVDVESVPLPPDSHLPERARNTEDLLYIIYTSGSTGQPKGVCVRDRSVLRLVDATNYIDWRPQDRIALTAAPSFDAITFEIWGALANGLSLVVVPQEVFLDPVRLRERLATYQVTLAFTTTALFNYLAARDPAAFSPLRVLLTGGDTCVPALLRRVMESSPSLRLHHVYGPTENTTFSTWHSLELPLPDRPPIGRPISHSTAWVVNTRRQPLPVGAQGELLLGGAGVASGYWKRPELTAARFVSIGEELSDGHDDAAYLTGDIARWLPDGTIDFLGRRDHQVKVQGYRVELDEIRDLLQCIPGIVQAEVLPTQQVEGGYRSIEAYFCCDRPVDIAELRERLVAQLPHYMVPARLVPLLRFPLTPNGKVDRASLVHTRAASVGRVTDARHDTDSKIVNCWCELLRLDDISIHDAWASLGGHSMLLLELAKRLHAIFGIEFLLGELVSLTTIAALSDAILARRGGEDSPKRAAVLGPADGRDFPVLPTQRQIFLNQQRSPESAAFHVPLLMRLDGDLDEARLAKAWSATLDSHPALRMSFHLEDGEVVQRLHERTDNTLRRRSVIKATLDLAIAEEIAQPFDLTRPTPLRLVLLTDEQGEQRLLLVCHHVSIDGIALERLVDDLASWYRGETPVVDDIGYAAALRWTCEQIQDNAAEIAHLVTKLEGSDGKTRLHLPPATRGNSSLAATARLPIDPALQQRMLAACRIHGVTSTVVLMGALYLLLWQYGGGRDICLGTPVSGRWRHALSRTVGMFAGTAVLRQQITPEMSLRTFLASVDMTLRDVLTHERADYESVSEALARGGEPLFNVLFSMQSLAEAAPDFGARATATYLPVDGPEAKYDLAFRVQETGAALALGLEYRCSFMTAAEASRFLDRYVALLTQMVTSPEAMLSGLEGLTEHDCSHRAAILMPQPTADHEVLPSALARHMREQSNREALTDASSHLSWGELARCSTALAAQLVGAGVRRGDVVGLYLPRSSSTIVAMLGCWRIGAAYLALDIDWDAARVARQAELAAITALVVNGLGGPKPPMDVPLVVIAEPSATNEAVPPPFVVPAPTDIAYVIFTSGSTGLPKGVPITHGNLAHYAHGFCAFSKLNDQARSVVLSSLSFDLAYTAVWPVLLAGGSVHVAPSISDCGPQAITDFIAHRKITLAKLTPSLLNVLVQLWIAEPPVAMRMLVVGGEILRVHDVRHLTEALPTLQVVNHYGPTEATIGCIATLVESAMLNREVVPIGRPIDGMRALVLDSEGRLLPSGLVGELCVAGAGVSPGYIYAEATQTFRFVPAPALINAPMYRTGDLAHWDDEGRLVLSGRADRQVKIRGYRIELAELERSAEALPGIGRTAAFAVRNAQNDLELALAVTAKATADVRALLAEALPAFMQPTHLYKVDSLPLNRNGKVDADALVRLHTRQLAVHSTLVATPCNEPPSMRTLREIWQRQTGLQDVPGDALLISVGGSSLQILRFFGELRRIYGDMVTLPEVFASSLCSLAARLDAKQATSTPICAEFLANVRPVIRYAHEHRVTVERLLAAVVAQVVYEDQDDDVVALRLLNGGIDLTLVLDFGNYDGPQALLDDVEAQWMSPSTAEVTPYPPLILAIDEDAGTAFTESNHVGAALSLQVNQDGLICQAYAAEPVVVTRVVTLADRLHQLLQTF